MKFLLSRNQTRSKISAATWAITGAAFLATAMSTAMQTELCWGQSGSIGGSGSRDAARPSAVVPSGNSDPFNETRPADPKYQGSRATAANPVSQNGRPGFDTTFGQTTPSPNGQHAGQSISNGAASIDVRPDFNSPVANAMDDADIRAQTGLQSAYQQPSVSTTNVASEPLPPKSLTTIASPTNNTPFRPMPTLQPQRTIVTETPNRQRSPARVAAAPTPVAGQSDNFVVDRSVSPASYAAPIQDRRTVRPDQRGPLNQSNQSGPSANRRQAPNPRGPNSAAAKSTIEQFSIDQQQPDSNSISLRLADVLRQGQQRAARLQLVNQYWELFFDQAQSISAQRHRDWVGSIRVSKNTDKASVSVAQSSAENEVTFKHIQLTKSQAKLKALIGSNTAIVPSDLPTVNLVKTNYAAFKERGMIPARFDGIDATLTEFHSLIVARAETVQMAQQTAEQVKQFYQSNQTSIEHLLSASRAWRSAEADFIASTVEYNNAYADYALALPYGRSPIEKVVSMLVAPRSTPNGTAANVARTRSNAPPARGGRSAATRNFSTPSQTRQRTEPNFSTRSATSNRPSQPRPSSSLVTPTPTRQPSPSIGATPARNSGQQFGQTPAARPPRSASLTPSFGTGSPAATGRRDRSNAASIGFQPTPQTQPNNARVSQPVSSGGSAAKPVSTSRGFAASGGFNAPTPRQQPTASPTMGSASKPTANGFSPSSGSPANSPKSAAPRSASSTSNFGGGSGFSPPSGPQRPRTESTRQASPQPPSSRFGFGG